jgi:hypothetical protein
VLPLVNEEHLACRSHSAVSLAINLAKLPFRSETSGIQDGCCARNGENEHKDPLRDQDWNRIVVREKHLSPYKRQDRSQSVLPIMQTIEEARQQEVWLLLPSPVPVRRQR